MWNSTLYVWIRRWGCKYVCGKSHLWPVSSWCDYWQQCVRLYSAKGDLVFYLSGHVFNLTSEFQCGVKVAAQTYDHAAAMVGKYHGLQELIKYIKNSHVHACLSSLVKLGSEWVSELPVCWSVRFWNFEKNS